MICHSGIKVSYLITQHREPSTWIRITGLSLYRILRTKGKVTGRDVYIAQDSNSIDNWGRLQYYQKLDDGLNKAQINEVLTTLSQLKNRETRTFSISALGDIRVRAGCKLSVNMQEAGINESYLVDECEHKFEGEEHTMSLNLKVYG